MSIKMMQLIHKKGSLAAFLHAIKIPFWQFFLAKLFFKVTFDFIRSDSIDRKSTERLSTISPTNLPQPVYSQTIHYTICGYPLYFTIRRINKMA
jgi:hypothetical protein